MIALLVVFVVVFALMWFGGPPAVHASPFRNLIRAPFPPAQRWRGEARGFAFA